MVNSYCKRSVYYLIIASFDKYIIIYWVSKGNHNYSAERNNLETKSIKKVSIFL